MSKRTRNATSSLRWYDPILLRIIPPLPAFLLKVLMKSCRVVRVHGEEREREALRRSGGKAVYATWHQRMSYHFHYASSRNLTILISQSRDGEYAARLANRLGFSDVRGSTGRRGFGALKELVARIKEGARVGMLADGPLGPARVAKIGTVIMAREAEAPILPLTWGADRCWVLNSWDRYVIPKPFAHVAIYAAEPIWVPRSAKKEDLDHYRQLLEDELNQGTRWCDKQFGGERPWRKAAGKGVPETGPLSPGS